MNDQVPPVPTHQQGHGIDLNTLPMPSSSVSRLGHRGNVMAVEFKSGALYHYRGVPFELFREAMTAPSVGKFLQAKIIDQFECEKIEQPHRDEQLSTSKDEQPQ